VSIYVCRSKVSIDVFQQKNPAKATGSSCGVGGVRLKGDPEGMDHARDVGEEGEDDVEEEVASASADQQNLLEEAVKTIFRIVEFKMKVKSQNIVW